MKITVKIVVIVILLAIGLVLARNMVIKTATRTAIQRSTGFDLELGNVSVGLINPVFTVTDMKLINPEDFPEAAAFEVRQLRVHYDAPSFFKDEVHLPEVLVDIPSVVVVRKDDGETNIERMQKATSRKPEAQVDKPAPGAEQKPGEKQTSEKPQPPPRAEKPPKKMRIDRLTVRLGKVAVHDYSGGGQNPRVFSYDLNVDRTFENVTDMKQVNAIIATEILNHIGGQVLNDLGKILQENKGDLKAAGKQLEGVVKDLKKNFEGLLKK